MRKKWPDENRRGVATRYARAAAAYKRELLREHEGTSGQREAVVALRGLNPWAKGGRFEDVVRWLGEFDSARTLVEEWPAMREFVSFMPPAWEIAYEEREAGGPPPEWMRPWLPLVAEWSRGWRSGAGMEGFSKLMLETYGSKQVSELVERESPFRRFLAGLK